MQTVFTAPAMMSFFEPKYLVDTDWAVHYLRGKRKDVVSRLQELNDEGLAISSISVAELYHGAYRSDKQEEKLNGLKDFFAPLMILGVDERIAERFGQEKAQLQKEGTVVDGFDLFIGCTALARNLALLTNNRKHYQKIKGLRIESI